MKVNKQFIDRISKMATYHPTLLQKICRYIRKKTIIQIKYIYFMCSSLTFGSSKRAFTHLVQERRQYEKKEVLCPPLNTIPYLLLYGIKTMPMYHQIAATQADAIGNQQKGFCQKRTYIYGVNTTSVQNTEKIPICVVLCCVQIKMHLFLFSFVVVLFCLS